MFYYFFFFFSFSPSFSTKVGGMYFFILDGEIIFSLSLSLFILIEIGECWCNWILCSPLQWPWTEIYLVFWGCYCGTQKSLHILDFFFENCLQTWYKISISEHTWSINLEIASLMTLLIPLNLVTKNRDTLVVRYPAFIPVPRFDPWQAYSPACTCADNSMRPGFLGR